MNRVVTSVRGIALTIGVIAGLFSFSSAYAAGPFDGLSGRWHGQGLVNFENGTNEEIRCNATYAVSGGGSDLSLQLSCASQSYKINAHGNVHYANGKVMGTMHEKTNEVDGTINGLAEAGHIAVELLAKGLLFSFEVVTGGAFQEIKILPHGNAGINNIYIEMRR